MQMQMISLPSITRFYSMSSTNSTTHFVEDIEVLNSPLFVGSRMSMNTFCTELLSIAETYQMSEKACNDIIGLVRRMTPNGPNNCPFQIGNIQLGSNLDPYECSTSSNAPVLHEKVSGRRKQVQGNNNNTNDIWRQTNGTGSQSQFITVIDEFGNQQQVEVITMQPGQQQIPRDQSNEKQHVLNQVEQNQVVGSLNVLTKDISTLKQHCKKTTIQNSHEKPAPQKRVMQKQVKEELDRKRPKFFVKILDKSDVATPICDLNTLELVKTVRISREDPNKRIVYNGTDITERVLKKLDISLYLHDPSYCGRAVADALFNPEYLARFHILSEGQSHSRSNREIMPADLNQIFYDCLRKLGASRIVADDQADWMEQARDAVNQRNRDIKIPGCRRKFFRNEDPIFN